MESYFVLLEKNIEKLSELHRRLYDLLKAERRVLIDLDINKISMFSSAKESIAEEIRKEDIRRQHTLEMISKKSGSFYKVLSARELLKFLDQFQAEKLRLKISALELLVEKSSLQNRSNQNFIEHSLKHIDGMKKNILSKEPNNLYSKAGEMEKKEVNTSGKLLSTTA